MRFQWKFINRNALTGERKSDSHAAGKKAPVWFRFSTHEKGQYSPDYQSKLLMMKSTTNCIYEKDPFEGLQCFDQFVSRGMDSSQFICC